MSILYDIAFLIFGIFYIPYFLIKAKYRYGLGMKFGFLPKGIFKESGYKKTVWLHAVSVGEIQAARALISKLKEKFSDIRFVISTVTYTGNEIARKIASQNDYVIYLPFDISVITKKVVGKISPSVFIALETELWPNLLLSLNKAGVPIILINGRISDNSFKRYLLAKSFLKSILNKINVFCMQNNLYKDRIISIGAQAKNVFVTGNMKFDNTDYADFSRQSGIPPQAGKTDYTDYRQKLGLKPDEEFIVAGSTHSGEERIILEVYKKLKEKYANLKLLIAPRHVDRITDIEKLVKQYGFTSVKISELNQLPTSNFQLSTVFLLDTMGQLKFFYGLATIVFVGGSLVRHGGHNMIEAAVFSKAIIFGRYIFNFHDIAQVFLEDNAAIMVDNKQELQQTIERLINSPQEKTRLGQNAYNIVEKNKGATDRNIELISELICR